MRITKNSLYTALHGLLQAIILLTTLWLSKTVASYSNLGLGLLTGTCLTCVWGWSYKQMSATRWSNYLTTGQAITCAIMLVLAIPNHYLPLAALSGLAITEAISRLFRWSTINARLLGEVSLGILAGFFLTPAIFSMTTLGALIFYAGEDYQYALRVTAASLSGIPLGLLLVFQKGILLKYAEKMSFTASSVGCTLLAVWVKQPSYISHKSGVSLLCLIGAIILGTSWCIQWIAGWLSEPTLSELLDEERFRPRY